MYGQKGNSNFLFPAYTKFKQLHFSINVCGLKRAHKIHLCRQGIAAALKTIRLKFKFDVVAHNKTECRKYRVCQSNANNRIKIDPQTKNELHMVRCPPLDTDYYSIKPKSLHLYYVASNSSGQSITLFMRENDRNSTPKLELTLNGLAMEPLLEHTRREKFLPWQSKINTKKSGQQKSYQEIANEINSSSGEVRMPMARRNLNTPRFNIHDSKLEGLLKSTRDRALIDHVSIAFSKIKTTKLSE